MSPTLIQHLLIGRPLLALLYGKVHDRLRLIWGDLGHLWAMDAQRLSGLGLEPILTTSELAEYLGVHVQAIYDLRSDGRGPTGIRVGREIRYRVSDVLHWLDDLHEPERSLASQGSQR
jgi:excisionase family DNA binding protein